MRCLPDSFFFVWPFASSASLIDFYLCELCVLCFLWVCVSARALPHFIFHILFLLPAAATIDDDDYCDQPDYSSDNADGCPGGTEAHGRCRENGSRFYWRKGGWKRWNGRKKVNFCSRGMTARVMLHWAEPILLVAVQMKYPDVSLEMLYRDRMPSSEDKKKRTQSSVIRYDVALLSLFTVV